MLDKISLEAYLMLESWVEVGLKLAIFGNLKLQVTFHFGKLLIWLQNLQCRHLSWWMNLFGTWMKCLKPFLHLLALSWHAVDFHGPQMTWNCIVDFEPLTPGQVASKWTLGSHKLIGTPIGPLSHGKTWSLAQLTSPDASPDWCNAMDYAMWMQC